MTMLLNDSDIVDGSVPGGATTSRSIIIESLEAMLEGCPRGATFAEYEESAVERNLLGKQTYEGRRRAFRGLRELYIMDAKRILFRALRDLWFEDIASRAQLAGLCALARDSTFRASGNAVLRASAGDIVSPDDIAAALAKKFPGSNSEATLQKSARNTASSWLQVGHLVGRTSKRRTHIQATPVALTYAMLLGHLQGIRGDGLLESDWVLFLDLDSRGARDIADAASRNRYLEFKSGGGVTEIGFRHLLRDESST